MRVQNSSARNPQNCLGKPLRAHVDTGHKYGFARAHFQAIRSKEWVRADCEFDISTTKRVSEPKNPRQSRTSRTQTPRTVVVPLVDMHVHLLAGLDDGPRTLDDAVAMCQRS